MVGVPVVGSLNAYASNRWEDKTTLIETFEIGRRSIIYMKMKVIAILTQGT